MHNYFKVTLVLCLFVSVVSCGDSNGQGNSDLPVQLFPKTGDFAGSHILIGYAGAQRAAPTVTRSKEEALAKAKELIIQLNADPSTFAKMAEENSDGPSASKGGSLGAWEKGRMVPEFDTAIEALETGAFTPEPVETGFGYHIIIRNSLDAPHYGASGFFVAHNEKQGTPPEITNSKAQADSIAKSLEGKINADNFAEMATQYNDVGDGEIFLGAVTDGDQNPPELLEALKTLNYGEVAGPIEYPFGYGFVKRVELSQSAGSHILIQYQGSMRATPSITRSKEEALELAQSLITQINDGGDFVELAKQHSNGPSGPTGGDLGTWFKGQMVPEFDVAIDGMAIGEITSEPIETPFGYHVIMKGEVK